jgi:hypothetical protein
VDRNRDLGLDDRRSAGCALGIKMSGGDAGAPSADRERCDLDAALQPLQLGMKVGVPREVDRGRPVHQVPERRTQAADRVAAAVVVSGHRLDLDAFHIDPIARVDLDPLPYPGPAQDPGAPARGDHQAVARHEPQRGRVEVVVVRMRDQDAVESANRIELRRRDTAANVENPPAQHRIGQQSRTAEFDEERRMPDICDCAVDPVSVSMKGSAGDG